MEQQRQLPTKPKPKEEGCKIRIKNTKSGREISFHGKCGKNELRIAQGNIADDSDEED